MSKYLEMLNDKQKEAVTTINGPIMIVAGAGSGKTRVLTNRIAYLIDECDVVPYSILAVTFTNKAAKEMKERVNEMVGLKGYYNVPWIATFHSFCANVLRKNIHHIGYKNNYEILDEEDKKKVLKTIIEDMNLDKKEFPVKKIAYMINDIKKTNMLRTEVDHKLKSILERYNLKKKQDSLLDFDDLIEKTIELFESVEEVRDRYKNKFKYIMVDEFQDTSNEQMKLIKLITNDNNNIMIVGDQDQSIYSFRGANVKNMSDFERIYKDTKIILLEENYRSTSNILNAANSLISKNEDRIDKNLWTSKQGGDLVTFFKSVTSHEEATYVSKKIKEFVNKDSMFSDCAVLYRSNAMSREFEESFIRNSIPYVIYGGISFFARREIKDILSFIRLSCDFDSPNAFRRVVNIPKRGIGPKAVEKVEEISMKEGLSLIESINEKLLTPANYKKFLTFKEIIMDLSNKVEEYSMPDFISYVTKKTGYYSEILTQEIDGQDRLDNINELKSIAKEKEMDSVGDENLITNRAKWINLLEELSLKTDKNENHNGNAVVLTTIHQAKGLEFDNVFIVGMETGKFPLFSCLDSIEEMNEERRIFYVAITRAKNRLFLTNSNTRMQYGEILSLPNSMFLEEIDPKYMKFSSGMSKVYMEDKKKIPYDFVSKKEEFVKNPTNNTFKKNDKINHKSFGDGIVLSVEDNKIEVAFDVSVGVKKLLSNHPSIMKK